MTLQDRFQSFLNYYNLNQTGFARKTSYKQRNLSTFLTGNVVFPRSDLFIIVAEHFPDVNITWLLTGEGEMMKSIETNEKIILLKKEKEDLQKENTHLKDLIKSKDKIISLLENQ